NPYLESIPDAFAQLYCLNFFSTENSNPNMRIPKKLEEYGKIFRHLSAIEGYNNKILFGSQDVKNSVESLYRDIESGNGERVNYEKFVKFETKKVNDLHALLVDLERVQRENIQEFHKVHPEIEKFVSTFTDK
ncbi:MAG: hypothetical protein EB100_08445, partial [Crocinitomicaceae bacterium]|nr:hypothetical protein [Crocinitomicaceae bacterium]